MKARRPFDQAAVGNDQDYLFQKIARRLSPAQKDEHELTPAWRWKLKFDKCVDWQGKIVDPESWLAIKLELFEELGNAPGEARYVPGEQQWEAHKAASLSRTVQVAGGWRAGKSKWLAAELLPYTLIDNAVIWNVAPTFDLAREEFKYVHQWLLWLGAPLRPSTPNSGAWTIKTEWNAWFQTKSGDDPTLLEAANLNVCGMAEAGLIGEDVLIKLRGRVLQKGGCVHLSGSFEQALPWYFDKFKANRNGGRLWHSFAVPSWENKTMFPGGREDKEILDQEELLALSDPTGNMFKMKIAAEPVKPPTLVFPMFDESTHVVNMEFMDYDEKGMKVEDPIPKVPDYSNKIIGWTLPKKYPVELAIDPGFSGAYAVLAIQKHGDLTMVIDEVYLKGAVAEEVIQACKERWWWPQVVGGVIDKASMQHQGQKSHWEIWTDPKFGNVYLRKNFVPIVDGTQRLRTILIDPRTRRPLIYFAAGKTENSIREFGLYRYRPSAENRAEREEPLDRDNHCFDDKTEVLTDRGWVRFADLASEDMVATRDEKGYLEYQQPTEIIEGDYKGPLYVAEGYNIDFAVTPEHRLFVASQYSVAKQRYDNGKWIKKDPSPKFSFATPGNLPTRTWFSRTAKWNGVDIPDLNLGQGHGAKDRTRIDLVSFARFLGLWLAEGCKSQNYRGSYYVHIDQKDYVNEVRSVVAAMGMKFSERDNGNGVIRFSIASKELFEFLPNTKSHTKRVPRWILGAKKEVLSALIEGYLLGDGSKSGTTMALSASKELLDDMQEAAFKTGRASYTRFLKCPSHKGDGYNFLSLLKEGGHLSPLGLCVLDTKKNLTIRPYNGKVYCVTVPNGVIAVRRNGLIMWSGNSIKAITYWLVDTFGFVMDPGRKVKSVRYVSRNAGETKWNGNYSLDPFHQDHVWDNAYDSVVEGIK